MEPFDNGCTSSSVNDMHEGSDPEMNIFDTDHLWINSECSLDFPSVIFSEEKEEHTAQLIIDNDLLKYQSRKKKDPSVLVRRHASERVKYLLSLQKKQEADKQSSSPKVPEVLRVKRKYCSRKMKGSTSSSSTLTTSLVWVDDEDEEEAIEDDTSMFSSLDSDSVLSNKEE